ncbi:MAG: cytochrome c biogenesis protein CcsA [Alicyclobacillaceae bacterium]|nr:cytochrome c biogenesis protein CcsA [Alicyclobacillaceae bacterium]
MSARYVYDLFGLLYAASLVFLFIDAVQPRRSVNRLAVFLLFLAFLLETVFLLLRLRQLGAFPAYSRFDATLLWSWLIVLTALCVTAFFRVDLLLFFANLLGFALVALDTFARQQRLLAAPRAGDLLALHVSLALLSYAAFSFAFVFSAMYLTADRMLRRKRWGGWYFRLLPLERLDKVAYRSILLGFPLLSVAMVLGAVYERIVLGHFLLWDAKLVATILVWMMYAVYLVLRLRSGWGGKKLGWYSVACYGGVIANFFVVGSFSFFHHSS